MDESISRFLRRLERTPELSRRRLLLAAWLNSRLDPVGGRATVVGGAALEFYTQGGYATGDLDLISVDRALVGRELEKLGFERAGRYWEYAELDLAVEVPNDMLMVGGSPGNIEKLVTVRVRGIGVASVIGIEDLVVDRLLAARFWKDEASERWARALLRYWGSGPRQRIQLDWSYLDRVARREGVDDLLELLWKEEIGDRE